MITVACYTTYAVKQRQSTWWENPRRNTPGSHNRLGLGKACPYGAPPPAGVTRSASKQARALRARRVLALPSCLEEEEESTSLGRKRRRESTPGRRRRERGREESRQEAGMKEVMNEGKEGRREGRNEARRNRRRRIRRRRTTRRSKGDRKRVSVNQSVRGALVSNPLRRPAHCRQVEGPSSTYSLLAELSSFLLLFSQCSLSLSSVVVSLSRCVSFSRALSLSLSFSLSCARRLRHWTMQTGSDLACRHRIPQS